MLPCSMVIHFLPDRTFCLISPLTLPNHILLCFLYSFSLVLSFPSPSFLRSALLFSSHAHAISTSFLGLSLRCLPLSLSPYSFQYVLLRCDQYNCLATYHIYHVQPATTTCYTVHVHFICSQVTRQKLSANTVISVTVSTLPRDAPLLGEVWSNTKAHEWIYI